MVRFSTLRYEIITHLFWISLITDLFGIWEKEMAPTPELLPRKSHGWRSLVGYSPWGRRVRHDWATFYLFIIYYFGIQFSNSVTCLYILWSFSHWVAWIFLLICNYFLYMWDLKPFWLYALEISSLSLWAIF